MQEACLEGGTRRIWRTKINAEALGVRCVEDQSCVWAAETVLWLSLLRRDMEGQGDWQGWASTVERHLARDHCGDTVVATVLHALDSICVFRMPCLKDGSVVWAGGGAVCSCRLP